MAMTTFTPGASDIVHNTAIDLILRPVQNVIHLVQYDKSLPIIEVELYRNGSAYTLPENAEVWLRWGTKDHIYTRKLTMVSIDRKKVYFRVTYSMAYFYGNINPILVVDDGTGKAAGSSVILVTIDKDPIQYPDGPAAPEDEILEEIQNKLIHYEDELDEKTEECITQIQNITEECIESIPSDYTALEGRVTALEENYNKFKWEIILRTIRGGYGNIYKTGDHFLINWKDHKNDHQYNDVEHDIVDHSNAIVKIDGVNTTVPALTLEWHYAIPFGLPFDPPEDLMQVGPNGMPAGRYFFKCSNPSGSVNNNKYFAFVVPFDLPEGRRLRPSGRADTEMQYSQMDVRANGLISNTLKHLTIYETTSEDSGIYLGKMGSGVSQDIGDAATYLKRDESTGLYLNHYDRVFNGYNRWSQSFYRQWLNAEGTDWWTEQNVFDRAPYYANILPGFLTGLDSQFKSILRPTKIMTIQDDILESGDVDITYDKIFLKSMANANTDGFSDRQNINGREGPDWEYYKDLAIGQSNLNPNGTFKAYSTYAILKKYAINYKTTAQYVVTRSGRRTQIENALCVNATGNLSGNRASGDEATRCAPACIIC